ncbi:Cof-type HAD-IIB family hydrolase [Weissella cibaria]|uniref:Cof-type HAD-IIB family hydrolase n=1 Tax=Weissella cibaria TaxID=137591 RepID=A0A9Q8JH93_9LACO|nr:Cof-type HAD-IIB family hydrolase [Weissella cibaria]QDG81844.1 Cof-type HAD-IIB family hydrolase [Weissella cibaria]QMU87996.1 Cof-type HAD-IIB family hydrolase [Weissella cibaria]TVV27151.1 Cof-type HAD-IIB family hydrolase [Weissella cibaria]TVV40350.1 Cof-type HAD-IIB family hydrolase [Weissella cibaria]UNW40259.1 Cof-type HAD-IIB family hydrolase [Weissella cibaria]
MDRKLIGIDLDKTTLNDAGEVSDRTRRTLQAAQREGHIVSIVTGRPVRLSMDIYDTLGLQSPMINFNGSLGHKPYQHWDHEYSFNIDREIAFDLLENAQMMGIDTVVAESKNDVWANGNGPQRGTEDAIFFPQDETGRKMLDRLNLQTDVNAILIHAENALHQSQIQHFVTDRYGADRVNVKTWGGESPVLEVAPAGVSKDTGLDILRKAYDIKRDDIYAFGDEMNDFEMIGYATHGVVMKNGNPELKAIADDMTDYTNEEDGLARYLEKLLKLSL